MFFLSLKENYKTLHDETVLFFDKMDEMKKQKYVFDEYTSVDGGHGRIETRVFVITSDIEWLEEKDNWKGLKIIGMGESTREIDGECSYEKRYYISSIDCDACDAQRFGTAVRKHWGSRISYTRP